MQIAIKISAAVFCFSFLQLPYYCADTVNMIIYSKKCKRSQLKMVVKVLDAGCYDYLGILITGFWEINLFQANVPFRFSLKTEFIWFSNVFRGYKIQILAWDVLIPAGLQAYCSRISKFLKYLFLWTPLEDSFNIFQSV